MKRKIYFRADASAKIGYGHFIRTLALADMLKEDFNCVFYTAEPSSYQIGEMQKVCSYYSLSEKTKLEDFIAILDGSEIVVLDNYFYTTEYQNTIKTKGCKLVCIDDMHNKHFVADAVINHGPVYSVEYDVEPYTKICCGLDWLLLRKPFLHPVNNKVRGNRVVVSFGGADPFNVTDIILEYLLDLENDICVILGDKVNISEAVRNRVEVKKNLSAQEIADLFETCKYGVLAASTICYEALSRGLPVIMGYHADNQVEGFNRLTKAGIGISIGSLLHVTRDQLFQAIENIQYYKPTLIDTSTITSRYINLFKQL